MPKETSNSVALIQHLTDQNIRIQTLKTALDKLIEMRQVKSYFNQLALSYGQTSWWKKAFLTLIFLPSTTAIIYISGVSLLMMLPITAFYFLSAFFLSNHYTKDHALQTETLVILENILAESVNALDCVRYRLSELTQSMETLNEAQKTEHVALSQQIKSMACNNKKYETNVKKLEPLVKSMTEIGNKIQQNNQALLSQLNQTQLTLTEAFTLLTETLLPQINQSIDSTANTCYQVTNLQTQFKKNLSHINHCVIELDTLLYQLEQTPGTNESKNSRSKTKQLVAESEHAIQHAIQFIENQKSISHIP